MTVSVLRIYSTRGWIFRRGTPSFIDVLFFVIIHYGSKVSIRFVFTVLRREKKNGCIGTTIEKWYKLSWNAGLRILLWTLCDNFPMKLGCGYFLNALYRGVRLGDGYTRRVGGIDWKGRKAKNSVNPAKQSTSYRCTPAIQGSGIGDRWLTIQPTLATESSQRPRLRYIPAWCL